jgi:hypothetical protein
MLLNVSRTIATLVCSPVCIEECNKCWW